MLQCNLRVVMAKKNLTASRISADTRISRVTLGALINNQAKGVQFETLNTLCSYLGITPGELFEFAPIDVAVKCVSLAENQIHIDIRDGSRLLECRVPIEIEVISERVDLDSEAWVNVPSSFFIEIGKAADQSTEQFMRYYNALPDELRMHVKNLIEGAVIDECTVDVADSVNVDAAVETRFFGER